jgi:hypothetical protein
MAPLLRLCVAVLGFAAVGRGVTIQRKAGQDDGPGTYRVVSAGPTLKALPVSKDYDRTSAKVGEVALQQELKVLEVAAELNDGRRRARIAEPAGWITLETPKKSIRFATKQQEPVQSAKAVADQKALSEDPEADVNTQIMLARTPGWIQNLSHFLTVENMNNTEEQTAIVTFAGKRNVEYIDGAIMLGMSIQKYLPDYPMVALAITAMKPMNKNLLRNAGWSLSIVPNWDKDFCGEECDQEFLGRWHDSFEKINCFRLPFKRVLFMDSDTYIFSSRILDLVKLEMPDDHIAMAKDGCKDEYNSGVMLYKPSLHVFSYMLKLVEKRQREKVLDQELINSAYSGNIKEVSREYNCVDTMGIQPGQQRMCDMHCSDNVVVSHFTGHPKPTAAKRRLLELVRRPGAPAIACTNTNFGSCAKWSEYYCDIREHKKKVSKNLQYWLHNTGECCHTPFDPKKDQESCKECPSTISIQNKDKKAAPSNAYGTYVKSNIPSSKYNGMRTIFVKYDSIKNGPLQYLYFVAPQFIWAIGTDYTTSQHGVISYAQKESQCPRDTTAWSVFSGMQFQRAKLIISTMPNIGAPNDTEHVSWNMETNQWDRDGSIDQSSLDSDDDKKDE